MAGEGACLGSQGCNVRSGYHDAGCSCCPRAGCHTALSGRFLPTPSSQDLSCLPASPVSSDPWGHGRVSWVPGLWEVTLPKNPTEGAGGRDPQQSHLASPGTPPGSWFGGDHPPPACKGLSISLCGRCSVQGAPTRAGPGDTAADDSQALSLRETGPHEADLGTRCPRPIPAAPSRPVCPRPYLQWDSPVLHPHPWPRHGTSKASAGLPVPLSSGVTLSEASAAARQRWQAEAVRAGAPWQRDGQEGQGQRAGTCVVTKMLCLERAGPPSCRQFACRPTGLLIGLKLVVSLPAAARLAGETEGHLSPGVAPALLCGQRAGQMSLP